MYRGLLQIFSCLLFFGAVSAQAAVLTYDQTVFNIYAGQSISIGATLTEPGLQTDVDGRVDFPVGHLGALYVAEVLTFDSIIGGTTDSLFRLNSSFTVATPNPIANLNAATSVHLILGDLQTFDSLPVGTYTADIGIYEQCVATWCFSLPFDLPDFADAGFFTINVLAATATEPTTLALLGFGIAAIGTRARRTRARAIS